LDKNEPFYVGISQKRKNAKFNSIKSEYERAFVVSPRNPIWKNIEKKTLIVVEIVFETNDYNLLLQKEIEFIKLYGRIDINTGCLANFTDGGEGIVGASEETKKKISEKLAGIKRSTETKNLIRQKRKLQIMIPRSEECRKSIGKANSGKNNGMYGKCGNENPKSKEVFQYSLQGDFIKKWANAREIDKELGIDYKLVSDQCVHKRKFCREFIFRYEFIDKEMFLKELSIPIEHLSKRKEVYLYDVCGNFIRKFDKITDVTSELHIHFCTIRGHIKNKTPHKGFIFSNDPLTEEEINNLKQTNSIKETK